VARELGGDCDTGHGDAIAVIGDGALSGGMAYEAMNNAGHLGTADDRDPQRQRDVHRAAHGAMSSYLSRALRRRPVPGMKAAAKGAVSLLPEPFQEGARRAKELLKAATVGGTLFEELGLQLYRPHRRPRHGAAARRPAHRQGARRRPDPDPCDHEKGQGLRRTPPRPGPCHREVRRGDGRAKKAPSNAPSYTKVFANALIREAEDDPKIVAVTAAMPDGTGLDLFGERFPTRTFDVGIAEQHAVTMCAGMAAGGSQTLRRDLFDLPATRL
jgi:1-deoxy-D-xylulose-5-phosphate synthase